MSGADGSIRVILIALFANLGIAISKFVGAYISGSASMLAEAIHSMVDCTNQVLLIIGSKASKKEATAQHPLGFGREAFFWSFIVAVLLFTLGGLFAIYEGWHKLHETHPVHSPILVLSILGVGIILESISFRACLIEVRKVNPYGNITSWFKKTTASELLVIFTEDAAALLGLVTAAVFVTLSWLTDDSKWDAIGSMTVGFLLVIVAYLLASEIKSLIIGESPTKNYLPEIEKIVVAAIPGGRVLRVIALQTGPHEVMLAYKVNPGTVQDVTTLINSINSVEEKVRAKFTEVKWQFVEPDFVE